MVSNIKKIFLFYFILFTSNIQSQVLSGKIKNTFDSDISDAILTFSDSLNATNEFTIARNGKFYIELKKVYKKIIIEVKLNGYRKEYNEIINPIKGETYNVNFILKEDETIELKEVVIVSDKKPYEIKKDTLAFNVNSYKKYGDRKVQDVLRRIPGIVINEKSGQIKYDGKPIENVTLDGDDLFGYNYTLGTKNINIDMIDQVQAISNYSSNPLLKGIESGEKVSLNLKLKKDKIDYSGNIEFGLGIDNNSKILNNLNANILRITNKYKSFGILSYNNIGKNNSPFDYFSNNENIESIKEKNITTQKVISESLFSNIIDDERSNINSLVFSNYNSILKINKNISFKTNLYYLKDDINFTQSTLNELSIDNTNLITSDNFNTNKKPQLYRGDFEVKFNISKNSLLETKTKFSYEQIKTTSSIIANNINELESNLSTKNSFFNQNLIFTNKLSSNKAFQINAIYAYNDIPQELILSQTNIINKQNSNFKKKYFDTNLNFLGNTNKLKYSVTLGGVFQSTPYLSNLNQSNLEIDNNIVQYNKSNIYNRASLIYNPNKNLTFTPSYSIKILNQKINYNLSKNDLLIEPSLFLRYKINNKSSLSTKINYLQNTFDEGYIYKNPILINNRIKVSNKPSLENQKLLVYTINYLNHNLYNQFLISFDVNYHINNGAYFSEYLINDDETFINNFFSNKKSRILSFDFSSEKFISMFSTLIKIKSYYNKNSYVNIVNTSELRNNVSHLFTNEFSLKTAFNAKINIENNLVFNYLQTKSSDNSYIQNKSLINSCKIKYKFSQSIFNVLTLDYYLPNSNNENKNYLFLDFNLILKHKDKKYEFNLIGKNLANIKYFSQIQATDFSKSIYQSNLISRYIFLNFTYNL